MLSQLSIKNYALIERLSVRFENQLSIITGETGAGKSILLGALSLVLGKRADLSALKNKDEKCIVEAHFLIKKEKFETLFEENNLDFETETIIRREILPSGKSRAFINDTPTTLQVINILSEKLIDIHSQHETLLLANTEFQFQLIDALAKNDAKIASYQRGLKLLRSLQSDLEKLRTEQQKNKEQFEYNNHLFNELKQANLQANEQEEIEQILQKLNNVEDIKIQLSEIQSITQNEEIGVQTQLNTCENHLSKIAKYASEYNELYERIHSVKIELDDIISEVENSNENLEFNPSELEKYNSRLQLIFDLQKKHNVGSISELLNIKNHLESELNFVANSSEIISKKETEVTEVTTKIDELAYKIHQSRLKAIPVFVKKLEFLLHLLNMSNTRLQIKIIHNKVYSSNGKDSLDFLISADKGKNFKELKKTASGGELSRIMLATKSILSEYLELPTIIFDEIDTGVSGEIAQKMADIMQQMANNMQVIAITHLPQIAVKGKQHYKVYKTELGNKISTQLKQLSEKERITEIAEMLGGKNITDTALQHAKQLLNST